MAVKIIIGTKSLHNDETCESKNINDNNTDYIL